MFESFDLPGPATPELTATHVHDREFYVDATSTDFVRHRHSYAHEKSLTGIRAP